MFSEKCKYARGKYNMTPNDYDIYFDYTSIPSNINLESASSLHTRLQDLMPLTKVLHLHLGVHKKEPVNNILINTQLNLKVKNKKIKVEFI